MKTVFLALAAIAAVVLGPVAQALAPQAPAVPQPGAAATPNCPEIAQAIESVVRNDLRLRDWAQLGRYRDANRDLRPPVSTESRVVFMGDSITDNWQQPRFGGFFPGKAYIDRGISGQTTPQMLVRFRPDVIDLKSKVVVILAGTNDIAGNTGPMTDEDIEANIASMSDLAHAHGIRVVLASVTPVSAYHHRAEDPALPQTTRRPMSRIKALNGWLNSYTASRGDVYLDYFSSMVDADGVLKEDMSADDLHPNAKGYAVMAPLAEAAIARTLK